MAALFNYSFNNINTAALPGALANTTGSPTVGSGDGPQGINTFHTDGATAWGWLPNIGIAINTVGLILGGGFNVAAASAFANIFAVGSQGTSNFANALVVQVASDGSMQVGVVEGTYYSSPSGTFTFGNRHEIELKISEFSSTASVTLYLDGVSVSGLTSLAFNLSAMPDGATIHSVAVGGSNAVNNMVDAPTARAIVCDSFYAFDTSGSFCNAPVGPAISVPMIPNAPGQESAWTPNGASLGWECISEIPPDGDTTYISSSTPTQEEACALSAPSGISGVYCVSVISDQRQDTSGGGRTIELGLGNGTTRSYGSAWGLGTTYKMNTTAFSENPFTSSAWTLAAMTGLQVAADLAS